MVRGIALILVGIGATINGIVVFGKEPSAIEKTGWAYQKFGSNGVSVGLMLFGVITFLIGIVIVWHEWKNIKHEK